MKKTLIITSYIEYKERINKEDLLDYDTVICADGGHLVAKSFQISPDYIIGDFDSANIPEAAQNTIKNNRDKVFNEEDLKTKLSKEDKIIVLPSEKDMTDTEAALSFAVQLGAKNIDVLGGLGGRIDHTLGNLSLLAKYTEEENSLRFFDGLNMVTLLVPGTYHLEKLGYKYTGLLSYTPFCKGITLKGFKYPLTNHTLTFDTTLGISNEIIGDSAELSFNEGLLLLAMSNDAK